MRGTSPLRSSLTLEMLLTLSWYYIPVYFVPTIIVFLYKGPRRRFAPSCFPATV